MARSRRNRKKSFLPLIIAATSALLIVAGIMAVAITESGSTAAAETRSAGDTPATTTTATTTTAVPSQAADLLKVDIPAGIHSQIKDYAGFTLSFNADNRTPNYVAWELLGSETEGTESRSGKKFWTDPDIRHCPADKDYSRSGFDRGHMCPAADQKWSPEAMADCFVMANICPQDHALNAGAWNTLENKERAWAKRDSALIIVAGPIFEKSDTSRLPRGEVRIPSAFFKVILAPYLPRPRAIGFIYPNMSSPGNMQQYAMSVDDVEKTTGLDFFSALPDDVERDVESKFSFREWTRH